MHGFTSPCLVGIRDYYLYADPSDPTDPVAHMTTGVGYNRLNGKELVYVHDNWPTTGVDVAIAWTYVDFLFSCAISNN